MQWVLIVLAIMGTPGGFAIYGYDFSSNFFLYGIYPQIKQRRNSSGDKREIT